MSPNSVNHVPELNTKPTSMARYVEFDASCPAVQPYRYPSRACFPQVLHRFSYANVRIRTSCIFLKYPGGTTRILANLVSVIGSSVGPDLNNDGVPERLELPPRFVKHDFDGVKIICGASGAVVRSLLEGDPVHAFGWDAAWVGDADGDGQPDVVVASPLDLTTRGLGRATVLSSATGMSIRNFIPEQRGQFAVAVESIPDIDGDGVADVRVWSKAIGPDGRVQDVGWIFSVRSAELLTPFDEASGIVEAASDVDDTGSVTHDDAVVVMNSLGSTAGHQLGEPNPDADGNGIVTFDDAVVVMNNLGAMPAVPPKAIRFVGWTATGIALPTSTARETDRMPFLATDQGCCPDCPTGCGGCACFIDDSPVRIIGEPEVEPWQSDEYPSDPHLDGPACAPVVTLTERHVCLRPETPGVCAHVDLTASGGAGTGPYLWSVTGGVFVVEPSGEIRTATQGPRVNVRACQPGQVVVSVSRQNPACAMPRRIRIDVFRFDVDNDSHSMMDALPPLRTLEEELAEAEGADIEAPGKVWLVPRGDGDGDGLIDLFDGMDLIDPELSTAPPVLYDDSSNHESPTVVVSLEGPIMPYGVVRIAYSESPASVLPVAGDALSIPPGSMRLWRVRTNMPRDRRSILDGGDSVPAGDYRYGDLVARLGPQPWLLYVEAVRPDLSNVAVIVDPDGTSPPLVASDPEGGAIPFICPDDVQFTLTSWGVQAKLCPTCEVTEWLGFPEATLEHEAEVEIAPEWTGFPRFRVTVDDWRQDLLEEVRLEGVPLPLAVLTTGRAATPWVHPSGLSHPTFPDAWFVPLGLGPEWSVEYNPFGWGTASSRMVTDPQFEKVRSVISAEVSGVAQTFNQVHQRTTDPGLFGRMMHAKVGEVLNASGDPRWLVGVWIHKDTGRVMQIGGAGPDEWNEIDIIYTKRGESIQVGDTFDREKVAKAFEMKFSFTGRMDARQRRVYDTLLGSDKYATVQGTFRQRRVPGQAIFEAVADEKAVARAKIQQQPIKGRSFAGPVGLAAAAVALGASVTQGAETSHAELKLQELIVEMRRWKDAKDAGNGTDQFFCASGVTVLYIEWVQSISGGNMVAEGISYAVLVDLIDDLFP